MKRITVAIMCLAIMAAIPAPAGAESSASISDMVDRVSPSVVSIFVVKREPATDPTEPTRTFAASGSGFAIAEGGYILSNAHVLDYALAGEITTSDGKVYRLHPDEIWADPVSDLAVAKVNAKLSPVHWANVTTLRVGDPVMAIGAPFGLRFRQSVSRGIISGFERNLDADYPFIQTDAPINPGNSGGPLVTATGEVVGVNTLGIRGADGMGFAIPADVAKNIAERLMKEHRVERAWLGLRFEDSKDIDLGWSTETGPVVTYVEPDGPAARSGIQIGDTITWINMKPIPTLEALGAFLRTASPGTPVTVAYQRGEAESTVQIQLSTRPHDAPLFLSADGLWAEMTAAQVERARHYGQTWVDLEPEDLQDPWTTYAGDAKAVLVTEYLAVARKAWQGERDGTRLSAEAAKAEGAQHAAVIEVQVDLPTRWQVGSPDDLWSEWQAEAGTTRAVSVQVVPGVAPPGFQRLVVYLQTAAMEKRGTAVLVLHISRSTDRRFVFDLDSLH